MRTLLDRRSSASALGSAAPGCHGYEPPACCSADSGDGLPKPLVGGGGGLERCEAPNATPPAGRACRDAERLTPAGRAAKSAPALPACPLAGCSVPRLEPTALTLGAAATSLMACAPDTKRTDCRAPVDGAQADPLSDASSGMPVRRVGRAAFALLLKVSAEGATLGGALPVRLCVFLLLPGCTYAREM